MTLLPTVSLRSLVNGLCVLCGALATLALAIGFDMRRGDAGPAPWLAGALVFGLAVAMVLQRVARRHLHALDERDAEQRAESLRFHTAMNNMPQGLCFFDGQQRLIVCNDRFAEIYRLSPEQVRPGTTLREILDGRFASGCAPRMSREAYLAWRSSIAVADKPSNTTTPLEDGRTIAIHHRPMPDGGWVATHDDITELRERQAEIEHMARHDALTGLANRVLFQAFLTTALAPDRGTTAVLCLDLDRFKEVNDTLGHAAGDLLLRLASARLTDCVRQSDLVARLGGDEFAIIQVDGEQPMAAEALAGRLLAAIAEPFDLAGQAVNIGTSIGIAFSGAACVDPDDLLKRADLALYDAKSSGGGTHSFFRRELDRRAQGRRELESDLRVAIAQGALELHYQALIGLDDEQVVAFEALVRWPHPRRGMVMPDHFIPLAEEVGLIDALGAWVLTEACSCAATWPTRVGVAVNLSPIQLRNSRLVNVVRDALAASGLSPSRLELEITESVPLGDNSISLATLHGLHALGVRISIDDFGAGFSSMSYLRRFPFDKIKIDRTFIRDVATDQAAQAIVGALVALGHGLDIAVTAEGIETMEQLEAVRRLGCTQGQGYLISTPRPAADLPAVLRREMRLVPAWRPSQNSA